MAGRALSGSRGATLRASAPTPAPGQAFSGTLRSLTAAKTGYSIHVDFPDPSKPHFMVLVKHDLRGIMTTLSGNAVTLEDGKRHGR
ncbi:hypothetical protein NBRC10512_004753 [Rhodotorula toruloides]